MNGSRTTVYVLLAVTALAAITGRIAHVELLFEPSFYPTPGGSQWPATRPTPMPTLSSNDRSRWCTVRALVDEGTWVIGRRDPALVSTNNQYGDIGIVFEDGWRTVDKVLKPGTGEFYSSKPPLLTVVVAAEYWVLKNLFGWGITTHTNHVVRTTLFTLNVVPFALFLWMLKVLLERHAASDWTRLFVFAAACHGTFINTFCITLNNHTLGAFTALAAIFPWLNRPANEKLLFGRLPVPEPPPAWGIALSGLFAGLTASLELPGLALAAGIFTILVIRSPIKTLAFYLPLALAPLVLQQVINYLAIGQWEPVYAKVESVWYRYEGSHWFVAQGQIKHGIDWAWQHESRLAYAFHLLIGHHGLFSLTPIWLLAFAGMIAAGVRLIRREPDPSSLPKLFAPSALAISLVLIGFYLLKSNNYGGMTSCLRWLLWLTPFWLIAMAPRCDRLANIRWARWLAYALLALSIFSAAYPAWNPWRHPWLFDLLERLGWVRY